MSTERSDWLMLLVRFPDARSAIPALSVGALVEPLQAAPSRCRAQISTSILLPAICKSKRVTGICHCGLNILTV
jgi:hypothetical protein